MFALIYSELSITAYSSRTISTMANCFSPTCVRSKHGWLFWRIFTLSTDRGEHRCSFTCFKKTHAMMFSCRASSSIATPDESLPASKYSSPEDDCGPFCIIDSNSSKYLPFALRTCQWWAVFGLSSRRRN